MKDVQNESPAIATPINRVGIIDLEYPVYVKRKDGGLIEQVATINAFVDLPCQYRGTHMSRFLETLEKFHGRKGQFPKELQDFVKLLNENFGSSQSSAKLIIPYALERRAPVSKKRSRMVYRMLMKGIYQETESPNYRFLLGAQVLGNSTCPCSKEISKSGAHNQRVKATVWVCPKPRHEIWFEDLVRLIERCFSTPLFALLKRPDERWVTDTSLENAKFVEDIAREIDHRIRRLTKIMAHKVEIVSYESIHQHNVYACLERKWEY